jgi:23S rRNA pseudouridine955/2504/2580 synthase/23S rRNA pseudouridine1911/1915/1917 synthase
MHKPAGLATVPGRGEPPGETVLEQLGAQLGLPSSGSADPRVRVVHRLDKDTSGVMVFALDSATQRHLSHQFQNNTTQKEYLALVSGRPATADGEVDAPLDRHPTSPLRMAVVRHGGRPARTAWRIEQQFRELALLRVFPKTGKTHQIRVHLRHIGLPLAIDPLYNNATKGSPGLMLSAFKRGYRPTRGEQERPLIDRLTLHAEKLRFTAPNGEAVEVVAPVPKDLRSTINMLGKYSAG